MISSPILEEIMKNKMECRICGSSEASNHNHYGASRICSSCRAFFMRSVQSGLHEFFMCASTKSMQCVIESKHRKSCKKCRFEKCLASGMKVAYVLSKQERCRRILSQMEGGPKSTPSQIRITPDDLSHLDMMFGSFQASFMLPAIKFYAANMGLLRDHMTTSCQKYNLRPLTFEEMQLWNQMDMYLLSEGLMEFIKEHGIIQDNDRRLITRNCITTINTIMMVVYAFFPEGHSDWNSRLLSYCTQSENHQPEVDIVTKELADLNLKGTWGQCHSEEHYSQCYSTPWAPEKSSEDRHKTIFEQCCDWFSKDGAPKRELDTRLLTLLCLSVVFSTDGIREDMRDRKKIEGLRLKYASMMWHYLKFRKIRNPHTKYHNGLMMAIYAQEAYNLGQNRLPI